MRTHLQGTFLLIVLLLAFWWMLGWAVPVLDDAVFGTDGAIVARARLEVDDPSADRDQPQNEPLDGNEVAELQSALTQLGFNPGPIDGIMGELTRQAVGEAKTDLGLAEASDRKLLETLAAALEALTSASDPDRPDSPDPPDSPEPSGRPDTPNSPTIPGNPTTPGP